MNGNVSGGDHEVTDSAKRASPIDSERAAKAAARTQESDRFGEREDLYIAAAVAALGDRHAG